MQQELIQKCLLFHPDTMEAIRKECNLNGKDDMKNVIDILKGWVAMQPHFKKKDFPDFYLERWVLACKGSVEKVKTRLDKMCTIRTLVPHFFENMNASKDFDELFDKGTLIICPKLTKEHHRVVLIKADKHIEPKVLTLYFKYCTYIAEFERRFDYTADFRLIHDLSALDLVKFVTNLNVVELRQVVSIYLEGYAMKVKGVHLITQSKGIALLINIVKQMLKPKIVSRIHVHKSYDELYDIIGKEVLPVDVGGNERSIKEIHDDLIAALSTQDIVEYIHDMNAAGTDEALRPTGKFNEEYAGTPGTFRVLSLD